MAERAIRKTVEVPASRAEVWRAFTTAEGAVTFFAPAARIEARPGGAYELLFMLDAEPGSQGSEGCTVLECRPGQRLCFTWNFPPHLPIRGEHTVVVLELEDGEAGTRVNLTQSGWQQGPAWDEGFAYFERAWSLVLDRLAASFVSGPLDWDSLD